MYQSTTEITLIQNMYYMRGKRAEFIGNKKKQTYRRSTLYFSTDRGIEVFCVAWRKGLRRVMCLPPTTHCYLLPSLSGTLPIFSEISKRSARFVLSGLFSRSSLVRSITRHGIAARYDSVTGRNALVCCKWFD